MVAFGLAQFIVLIVAVQRLAELVLSHRNEAWLKARGGVEWGRGLHPAFVSLHAGWLVAIFALVPADQPADPVLLAVFVLLQGGRLWVMATLGRQWTTRVIVVPGDKRVRHGPYRYTNHPNYWIVVAEIAILPLAFQAFDLAVIFSVLNGILLALRIRVEDQALASLKEPGQVMDDSTA